MYFNEKMGRFRKTLCVSRFIEMPTGLKFITAHAFACFGFLLISVIPLEAYVVHGKLVTYEYWWSQGYAAGAISVGAVMPILGVLFLYKWPFVRHVYTLALSAALVTPSLFSGELISIICSVGLFLFIAGYLFIKSSVKQYFASAP